MNIGLAIWPKSSAEWIELALGNLPETVTSWIDPSQLLVAEPYGILVVDGDSPGASFMAYYKGYAKIHGAPHLVVLGTPMSPAIVNVDWELEHTLFVAKPYRIEDVVQAVKVKIAYFKEALPSIKEDGAVSSGTGAGGNVGGGSGAAGIVPSSNGAKSLGYLSTLRLPDLIQMLCMSSWTGKIEICELAEQKRGEIYLNVGVLIHAQQDKLEAEEACYLMLNWGRCEFHFVEEHPPVVQTITTHWQGVMLEGARQLDEIASNA